MNAMATIISHSEDCILEVQDWLEDKNNPSDREMLRTINEALALLANLYHDLREDNE
jgi:hypothetical protein